MRLFAATLFVLLLACLFGLGCANRVSPSGGEKDTAPPVALAINPPNRTVNFGAKSVSIRFNEFVQLNNPQSEIFISPFMKERPDFKLRGKTLTVKFKQPLLPNTTYTINFGKSLQDLTEGNPLSNFEYAFSTGNHIDSLFIAGKLLYAYNNEPVKDALVAVYSGNADTLFTTTPPAQITRSDDNGYFRVSNLAPTDYNLFALVDKNANYYYDLPNESIAFNPLPIALTDTVPQNPTLRLFDEGLDKPKIMERKNKEYGHIELNFSKEQKSVSLQLPDSIKVQGEFLTETSAQNDTLHLWYRNLPNQNPVAFLVYSDTSLLDTVIFRKTIREQTLQPVKYISNAKGGRGVSNINYGADIWVKFNHPIARLDTGKIQVLDDTVQLNLNNKITVKNLRTLSIAYNWNPEKKYRLLLPDSTLTDYFGETNDEISIAFTAYAPDTYGTLIVKTLGFNAANAYLLQLYDTAGKLLRQTPLTETITQMPLLKPGEYKVVVVQDLNRNQQWDAGNYAKRLQPEPVFTPKNTIAIKENWETEVEIQLAP